jgi:hypothetical protein
MRSVVVGAAVAILFVAAPAIAGPETALREFAGGQVKKGVRTIGMGGDGATTGNYALVYKDAGGAIFDYGTVHFLDTGNTFTFDAVGFTTPTFWDDAAFYVIALGQHAPSARVWTETAPDPKKPPSIGALSDASVFVKFAKPITKWLSFGLMGAYELSQATLLPIDGSPAIHFQTGYLPSGGFGLHAHPNDKLQFGVRVILNHDHETRTQGAVVKEGLLRSYEYRLGAAYSAWKGGLLDAGVVALDRSNGLEDTTSFKIEPTLGVEQMIVPKKVWARAGLDETTWTTGMSVAIGVFKIDAAYLYNLAAERTQDVFGKKNRSLIVTLGFDYERALHKSPKGS